MFITETFALTNSLSFELYCFYNAGRFPSNYVVLHKVCIMRNFNQERGKNNEEIKITTMLSMCFLHGDIYDKE